MLETTVSDDANVLLRLSELFGLDGVFQKTEVQVIDRWREPVFQDIANCTSFQEVRPMTLSGAQGEKPGGLNNVSNFC